MQFGEAVRTCLNKYVTFSGRASRSEYWYFSLFAYLAMFTASLANEGAGVIAYLLLILPMVAAYQRRLHDRDKSGWWIWSCVFILPIPWVFVWTVQRGTIGENRYGPDPMQLAGPRGR